MSVDWDHVYWWKALRVPKEEQLARPIPFDLDFDQNVHETVEWLVRELRSNENFNREESFTNHIKEGWFHQEWAEGMFYHVCDSKMLLKFRADYENAFAIITNVSTQTDPAITKKTIAVAKKKCIDSRIAMWGVVGRDGYLKRWFDEELVFLVDDREDEDYQNALKERGIDKFTDDGYGYRWRCHKCNAPMPKSVRAWVRLTCLRNVAL